MYKRILSIALIVAMLFATPLAQGADILDKAPNVDSANVAEHWFYDQLSNQAQDIYNALYDMYKRGDMQDGKASYDLSENDVISQDAIIAYVKGDRTLFNDFAAAKDAFDLEHPEVWYMDSTYLCFRTATDDTGRYHVFMGPGISDDYYVKGVESSVDAATKTGELNAVVASIVSGARNLHTEGLSESDAIAQQVEYVHDEVVKRISYRFENECADGHEGYVRTVYALVTHEGVCEAYARSMQLILNKLGIPCVPIHGIQNSGDVAELHMWNAVKIGDKWYAVDATWDDPVKYNVKTQKLVDGVNGNDGREHQNYLLVGKDTIGRNWFSSGVVSSSAFEFSYPEIALAKYAGEAIFADGSGLNVTYTSRADMEGAPAGQFKVSFNGKGVQRAADEDGLYMLIKMHDEHADGTIHTMEDWYYCAAALYFAQGNEFFHDSDDGLYVCTPTCEYVEFALTTRAPDGYTNYDEWTLNHLYNSDGEAGFYHGDGSEIFCETERLYNAESDYEAPPYVLTQYPGCNYESTAGETYHMEVRWDDILYHPTSVDDPGPIADSNVDTELDDREAAMNQTVRVSYTTWLPDRDLQEAVRSELSETPIYDTNFDGIVDAVTYHFRDDVCKHKDEPGHQCSVEAGCPIDGLDFWFRGSSKWADDLTRYQFTLEGVVGSRSHRVPNDWEVYCSCPGACPACYRSQGIDWNLWGAPHLLDNPNDLDLEQITMQGVDGSEMSLAELQEDMKVDDLNGRLTLVVEPIGNEDGMSREKYEEVTGALEDFKGISEDEILSKSMYEITFTRLCKMIMLKTGDSLRMQIGYPAGYNENSNVRFKAYHFTRCDENLHPDCPHAKDENHVWGADIISVEEIPVTLTPYGLVVLCDSFSPFEIVALEGSPEETEKTVIVSADVGGAIYDEHSDNISAGAGSMITLNPGESVTLNAVAEAGYQIDSVSLNGDSITPGENGAIEIGYESIDGPSAILNATFAAVSVVETEEQHGMTVVAPSTAASNQQSVTPPSPETSTEPSTDPTTEPTTTPSPDTPTTEPTKEPETTPTTEPSTKPTPETSAEPGSPEPSKTPSGGNAGTGSGGWTGGGSGNTSSGNTTTGNKTTGTAQSVSISNVENGKITTDVANAKSGDTVTITVAPDAGYKLDKLTVTCDGKAVETTKGLDENTYSFVMPKGKVEISAEFAKITLPFADINESDWFYKDVLFVYTNGIMQGKSDDDFDPHGTMTRAELVTTLWRLDGKKTAGKNTFADVKSGAWYEQAVAWANENGIVKGFDASTFGPDKAITREQMAVILYRYAEYRNMTVDQEIHFNDRIADVDQISPFAKSAMAWASRSGLIVGNLEDELMPKNTTERVQAAAMLHRFCDL